MKNINKIALCIIAIISVFLFHCPDNNPGGGGNGPDTPELETPANLQTSFTGKIILTWDNNTIGEEGYYIERKELVTGNYERIATLEQNTTSYSEYPPSFNSHFFYRIQAFTYDQVSEYSNESDIVIPDFIIFQKSIGGSGTEVASDICSTNDKGYILAGTSTSSDGDIGENQGIYDLVIMKLDSSGDIEWKRVIGGSLIEVAYSVQETSDGGYIITGYTSSTDGYFAGLKTRSGRDVLILKLSSTGTDEWVKCYGGAGSDFGFSIIETFDSSDISSGYILTGNTVSGIAPSDGDITDPNNGLKDVLVMKLMSNGDIDWQQCYGSTQDDEGKVICQTTDSGYIIIGSTMANTVGSNDGDVENNNGAQNPWIIKLSSTGTIEWEECIGGDSMDYGSDIQQTIDGGYICIGSSNSRNDTFSQNHGGYDILITKLNSLGEVSWQKCIGGSDDDEGIAISQTPDSYIFAGITSSNDGDIQGNRGGKDIIFMGLNDMGEIEVNTCLGGSDDDEAASVKCTSEYGYALLGVSFSDDGDLTENKGDKDLWLLQLGYKDE